LGLVELSSCSRKLTDACRSAEKGDILKRVQELIEAAERARAHLPERDASATHDEPV
jgi:hypothetical protein